MSQRARIGVYQDGPFRFAETAAGGRLAPDPADAPFLLFACEVAEHFESLTVFARIERGGAADARLLLPPRARVAPLPPYGDLADLTQVARALARTALGFWRGLAGVDVVWAFGPHPFQLLLVLLGMIRRKRIVVGVRQDTRAYFRARLPNGRWRPVLAAVDAMDAVHRLLARRLAATVVGPDNARRYRAGRARVLEMAPSLVRAADVVRRPPERDWSGEIELLTVGRIDPEKNPLLAVEAIAALDRRHPGLYRLRWVGVGPLAGAVRRRAEELGVAERVELLGYVPFGPRLLELYRRSHAFVHVSLTEGVPQVLVEALASGVPVIATDVGGVRAALGGGGAGLLVGPSDAAALTAAIVRLSEDEGLRRNLVAAGIALARERTLEAEAGRVARFIGVDSLARRGELD